MTIIYIQSCHLSHLSLSLACFYTVHERFCIWLSFLLSIFCHFSGWLHCLQNWPFFTLIPWFPPLRVPSPSICFIISFPDEPHPGLCFDILTRFRNLHSLPISSCHFNTRNDLVFFLKLFLPCAHACSSSSLLLTFGQLFLYFT